MKILITQESDWFIRGPHNQQHIAEKLSLRGHEVHVIDHDILWRKQNKKGLYSKRRIFKDIFRIYDDARITVIRPGFIKVPILDFASLFYSHWKEIKNQVKQFKPDVVVGFGILNSLAAVQEVSHNKIPFIYFWIDLLHTLIPYKFLQPLGKIIEKKVIKRSNSILATNKRLKNRLLEMGACKDNMHILGFGINPDIFYPSLSGNKIKADYGFNEGDIVLLFIGMINKITGIKDVSLELAKHDNPKLKLIVIGDGFLENDLHRIQEDYNLHDRLILTGKKPYEEIPELIASADICLVPFHDTEITHDIMPLKIFDYMAMGKPIVSTRLPGIVEEFGEDNGIVYVDKPEDIIGMCLNLVLQNTTIELGKKARGFVEGRSWDIITDDFMKIIEDSIEKKSTKA
jgi:glycosyltransferase involved in cell wall biosynthesis